MATRQDLLQESREVQNIPGEICRTHFPYCCSGCPNYKVQTERSAYTINLFPGKSIFVPAHKVGRCDAYRFGPVDV